MGVLSAAEFKKTAAPEIEVPVPGGMGHVLVRKPDLQSLLFKKLLPLPLMMRVLQDIPTLQRAGDNLESFMAAADSSAAEFIDKWICLVAVTPRIVATRAEVTDDSVCVDDLPLELKTAIIVATFEIGDLTRRVEAAAEFRRRDDGVLPGPDRAPVAGDAAVVADRPDGPS
jgi:hypothetical protein